MKNKTRYYKPTFDDFLLLGAIYETKPNKEDITDWETYTVNRDSFKIENQVAVINQISHDIFSKDPKNLYRMRFPTREDYENRGFARTTPLYLHDRVYDTYIRNGLLTIIKERDVTMSYEGDTVYSGSILNVGHLDLILGLLDISEVKDYKLDKKLKGAYHAEQGKDFVKGEK